MRQILLAAALAAAVAFGPGCEKEDYTVLVDREEAMDVSPGGYTGYESDLLVGDGLRAEFEVLEGGGEVDFLVLSDSNLALWEANQQYEAVIEISNSTGGTKTGVVETTGDYWIIASNREDSTAARKIFYEVWRKDR